MKHVLNILALAAVTLFGTVSCNESLTVDTYEDGIPAIVSFTPASGPVGTEVTVTGENLQKVDKASIDGQPIEIASKISDTELILRTTSNARTGRITLSSSKGDAVSTETFTYTYPTPAITRYPDEFMVGTNAVFFGSGLEAVISVFFDRLAATVVSKSPTELVVEVPDLKVSAADITFTYFDGEAEVETVYPGASIRREVPFVTNYTPAGGLTVGEEVTAEGEYLNLVESITVGGIPAVITFRPENGLSIRFRVVDDLSFGDGDNSTPLVFWSFNGTEELLVDAGFRFYVPEFYSYTDKTLYAQSRTGNHPDHFFMLEEGVFHSADVYAGTVDPLAVTMSAQGGVCSAANQIRPGVTAAQYYAVKPYIFMNYLGSGLYFYGPAASNQRLSNFNYAGTTNPIMPSGSAWGTPIVMYRTLSAADPAENAVIERVKNGTLTAADFEAGALASIDLSTSGSSSSYTKQPVGDYVSFGAFAENRNTPWAPPLTAATENGDWNLETVTLVIYYKYNDGDFSAKVSDPAVMYKFGYMYIKQLHQDSTYEGGRANNVTFDMYWMRSPMD